MCGLAGVAGDLTNKDIDIFKDLIVTSVVRGSDATGIATYRRHGNEVELYKQAIESPSFIQNRRADRLLSPLADIIMGHTRKSTESWASKYSHDDAHPFKFDNIVGAHNGMIPQAAIDRLPHKLANCIDSENLIYSIYRAGIAETLGKVWGAWALSLMDAKTGTLAFIRNEQRPLSFAFSKDKRRLYWASEGMMLHWVLARYGEEMFTEVPQTLAPHTLIEFDLKSKEKIGDSWTMTKVEGGKEPEKKPVTGAKTISSTGVVKPVYHKPLSPEQVFIKTLEGLEQQLVGFDYSKRTTWAAKKRKRHDGLVKAIDKMYKQWEKGWPDTTSAEEEVSITANTRAAVKQLLHDDGCCFCCTTVVDDKDLDYCSVGSDGEVLCHTCAKDETLLSIAKAPKPKAQVISLPSH